VIQYRCTNKNLNIGEETTKVSYGPTSLTPEEVSAERLLELRRGHWSIENKSHWMRDTQLGEETTKVSYGPTSLTPEEVSAERLLELRRGHWSIENKSHWMRDTQLGEDASSVRCQRHSIVDVCT
jgi:predicted transposase YbfD/YdcC